MSGEIMTEEALRGCKPLSKDDVIKLAGNYRILATHGLPVPINEPGPRIVATVLNLFHENAELRRRAVKAESNVRRSCGVIGRLVGFLECPSLKTLAEDYLADMKRDWPSPRAEEEGE